MELNEKIALIEKLKGHNGEMHVSMLDHVTQNEIVQWTEEFCMERSITDDEIKIAIDNALNSRICDIIQTMEVE